MNHDIAQKARELLAAAIEYAPIADLVRRDVGVSLSSHTALRAIEAALQPVAPDRGAIEAAVRKYFIDRMGFVDDGDQGVRASYGGNWIPFDTHAIAEVAIRALPALSPAQGQSNGQDAGDAG